MLKKCFWMLMLITLTALLPLCEGFAEESHDMEMTGTISKEDWPEDQEEERKLLDILEKYTEIATKTRVNADFVPGMVTVLYGDELETRGIGTVAEAMSLVPGINFSLTSDKLGKTVVRGIPRIFASGHIKVLLNSVPLTTAFGIDPVPNMPMEQVERIEIMRGPGSAIHGEFAYAGVMNIITRKKGTRVFGDLERDNTYKGGGMFSWRHPDKDFNLSLNVAGLNSAGADISNPGTFRVMSTAGMPPSGPDALPDRETDDVSVLSPPDPFPEAETEDKYPLPPVEEAEYSSDISDNTRDQERDYRSGIFTLNYKNFSLNTHWFENDHDDFYQTDQWGVSASHKLKFSSRLCANLNLGWQERKFETENSGAYPDELTDLYPNAEIYGFNYNESLFHGGLALTWKHGNRHTSLLEWAFSKSALKDVWRENDAESPVVSPVSVRDSSPEIGYGQHFEGKDRLINSLTAQDEFRVSDQLTLTAGLRYDHYDDIGDKFSPRLAAVCRLNKRPGAASRHILKAQYARAFRPPTFLEMYAPDNPLADISDIESETIDTYEFGYVFRNFNTISRITLFYSDLKAKVEDMQKAPEQFRTKGVELELERPLIPDILKLDTNFSYAETENRDTGKEIPEAADWLANVGLIYQPCPRLLFALQYRYVSERNGEPDRHSPESYHTVDLTGNVFDLGFKGLTLSAGVKNLFEEDIRYYSGPDQVENNFPDSDDSDPGQWWWIKIAYEF
ncbi:TonB-dependent receptor [Desulfonema magnum]|nr:TonB-dependent receptor [Desulfonema magnum]